MIDCFSMAVCTAEAKFLIAVHRVPHAIDADMIPSLLEFKLSLLSARKGIAFDSSVVCQSEDIIQSVCEFERVAVWLEARRTGSLRVSIRVSQLLSYETAYEACANTHSEYKGLCCVPVVDDSGLGEVGGVELKG